MVKPVMTQCNISAAYHELTSNKRSVTCILALLHWEAICSAEPAPSEMKLSGKLQPRPELEPKT